MFGIGAGEFLIIAVFLLLAVGPEKMPVLFKTVGKSLRMARRATRELRETIGIDELMRDDDFRYPLRRPAVSQPQTDISENNETSEDDVGPESSPAEATVKRDED